MKVRCILPNEYCWLLNSTNEPTKGPVYNEICNVTGEDDHGYVLEEYDVGEGYSKSMFEILENPDDELDADISELLETLDEPVYVEPLSMNVVEMESIT